MSWGGDRTVALRRQIAQVHGTICWLCGQPIAGLPSADHVIPRSRGGSDDIENLRPAHRHCNTKRGNRMPRRRTTLDTPTDW